MPQTAISIKNLVKNYGKLRAVDNISFEVNEGEFFGFLGPNGAGKTTTINIITGLSNYNNGEVYVFGNDVVRGYRKARSMIGLCPQEINLDPFLTIRKILIYQGGYFGIKKKICEKRADELLELFGLKDKGNLYYEKLSGGMKRKVLIARALMHNPKILILDEPTAGADVELRHMIWNLLEKLKKKKVTIFLTTHYIEEAEKLCDRIAIMNKGKIVLMDDKEKIMKDLGKETIIIELSQIKKLPRELCNFKYLVKGKSLYFNEPTEKLDAVLTCLKKNDIKIKNISIKKTELEEIFLKFTKK